MRKTLFLVVIVLLVAFAGVLFWARSSALTPSIEGRWVGTFSGASENGGDEREVWLWFTDGTHVMFHDGCNTGGLNYEVDGSEVTFKRSPDGTGGGSSARACSGFVAELPATVAVDWSTPPVIEIHGPAEPIRLVRVIE